MSCWAGVLKFQRDRQRERSRKAICAPPQKGDSLLTSGNFSFTAGAPEADPLYAWISEGEQQQIEELRSALTPSEREQLASAPEDIRHDIMMCRFLRGHKNSIPDALQKLRAHLGMRRENRILLAEIRKLIPPDASQDSVSINPFLKTIGEFAHPWKVVDGVGTNDGMGVIMFIGGLMDMRGLAETDLEEARKFMLFMAEMRSVVLHNQSLREGRLARIAELRDWCGAHWARFLFSPRGTRMLIQVGKLASATHLLYPEMIGSMFMCNIESAKFVNIFMRILPEQTRRKFVLVQRGDWEGCSCIPRGLSPATVDSWCNHVNQHSSTDGWHLVTMEKPHCTRTIQIVDTKALAWSVQVGPSSSGALSNIAIGVRVSLLSTQSQQHPKWVNGESARLDISSGGTRVAGRWASIKEGVAIMEIRLEGKCNGGLPVLPILTLDEGHVDHHADKAVRVPPGIQQTVARDGKRAGPRLSPQLTAIFVLGLLCSLLSAYLVGDGS